MCFFSPSILKVILIENKEESLVRAQSRSAELGLKNIGFIQANLDYFTGPFHVGVSTTYFKVPRNFRVLKFRIARSFHAFLMTHMIQAGGGGHASFDAITKGRCEQKITDPTLFKAEPLGPDSPGVLRSLLYQVMIKFINMPFD